MPAPPGEIPVLLRDNVYENLRTDILTCRLAPGDDVCEQELAERYERSGSRFALRKRVKTKEREVGWAQSESVPTAAAR
jgi:hypothetical protein